MVDIRNVVTALGPGDPDDGEAGRRQRGWAIAAVATIEPRKRGYKVPSQSNRNGFYIVNLDSPDEPYCTCPDYRERESPCKHIFAVEYYLARESGLDLPEPDQRVARVTYDRDWSTYNLSQEREEAHFLDLLHGLCSTVEEPVQTRGRPRIPRRDLIYTAALKVYTTFSQRRAMTAIREADARGFMERAPSPSSAWRAMDNPDLTPVLEELVQRSALPLAHVESVFAGDGSGFHTTRADNYNLAKHGGRPDPYPGRQNRRWMKATALSGCRTHIICAVAVTEGDRHESPLLPQLLADAGDNFVMEELCLDGAYTSLDNFMEIHRRGTMPYIKFASNSRLHRVKTEKDELWNRMLNLYRLHRTEWLLHYHQRSNAETVFWMIQSKFDKYLRSRTFVAQTNEILLKCVCHNVCRLNWAAYDLGIDPVFADKDTFTATAGLGGGVLPPGKPPGLDILPPPNIYLN